MWIRLGQYPGIAYGSTFGADGAGKPECVHHHLPSRSMRQYRCCGCICRQKRPTTEEASLSRSDARLGEGPRRSGVTVSSTEIGNLNQADISHLLVASLSLVEVVSFLSARSDSTSLLNATKSFHRQSIFPMTKLPHGLLALSLHGGT